MGAKKGEYTPTLPGEFQTNCSIGLMSVVTMAIAELSLNSQDATSAAMARARRLAARYLIWLSFVGVRGQLVKIVIAMMDNSVTLT